MAGIFDHVDLRVRDVARAKPFYDALLRLFGFRGRAHGEAIVYLRVAGERPYAAFGINPDPNHVANETCFAFGVGSREEVDRIAAALPDGARDVEGPMACPEYTPDYYAVFFRDPDGNRLEVVFR